MQGLAMNLNSAIIKTPKSHTATTASDVPKAQVAMPQAPHWRSSPLQHRILDRHASKH
jgi:hypothetical protein